MTDPHPRDITVRDTFTSRQPAPESLLTLEFIHEATGHRRRVPLETPMSHAAAMQLAPDYREAGEVLLQVTA